MLHDHGSSSSWARCGLVRLSGCDSASHLTVAGVFIGALDTTVRPVMDGRGSRARSSHLASRRYRPSSEPASARACSGVRALPIRSPDAASGVFAQHRNGDAALWTPGRYCGPSQCEPPRAVLLLRGHGVVRARADDEHAHRGAAYRGSRRRRPHDDLFDHRIRPRSAEKARFDAGHHEHLSVARPYRPAL